MDNYINKLIKSGIGQFIDKSRDELLLKDSIYIKEIEYLENLEEKQRSLTLSKEEFQVIDAYISIIEKCSNKCSDISYFAGIKDTILLQHLDLIKTK